MVFRKNECCRSLRAINDDRSTMYPSDDRVDHDRWEFVTIMRTSETVAIVRSGVVGGH